MSEAINIPYLKPSVADSSTLEIHYKGIFDALILAKLREHGAYLEDAWSVSVYELVEVLDEFIEREGPWAKTTAARVKFEIMLQNDYLWLPPEGIYKIQATVGKNNGVYRLTPQVVQEIAEAIIVQITRRRLLGA
jgi:hypothetical protein